MVNRSWSSRPTPRGWVKNRALFALRSRVFFGSARLLEVSLPAGQGQGMAVGWGGEQ